MRVISRARLREFWQEHRTTESALRTWYRIVKEAVWTKPNDKKKTFGNSIDIFKDCKRLVYIFDVAGNNVRVICDVNFRTKIVYILFVLMHDEYSQDRWKELI
jgi:mRNA interferase HigB